MTSWCEWFFRPRFEPPPDRPILVEAVIVHRHPLMKCLDEWCNMRLVWFCMLPLCLAVVGIGGWMCSLEKNYLPGGIFLVLLGVISFFISCTCFLSVKIKKQNVLYISG